MIIDPSNITFKEIHKLMIGSIVPRPIALISTVSEDKVNNLAPFSYFNGVCSNPPTIMFAPARRGWDGSKKDTLINIQKNKQFVVNIISETFAEKMVMCSTDYASNVDEFKVSELTPVPSTKISPPRVEESKINFECELNKIIEIGDGKAGSGFIIIGTVILFHINDEIYDDGKINLNELQPLGRLAGDWYSRSNDQFQIIRKVKPE